MNGSSNGALSAGGPGRASVSSGTATLSGVTRITRHVASITAAPSSARTVPARRWTLAPARTTRVAMVSGASGTGRRKSKVRRAICASAPAWRANARARSAAGGPPCWCRALHGPRTDADGTNRSPAAAKKGGRWLTPLRWAPGRSWAACSLADADLIGELVLIIRAPREMAGQHLSDVANRVQESLARPLIPEVVGDRRHHPSPVVLAHAFVDPLVADHRELSVGDRHVDEHAMAVRRLVHPKPLEYGDGLLQRIALAPVIEVHADLGGGAAFALAHGMRDGRQIVIAQELPYPSRMPRHHQSPLAPPPPKPPPPPLKSSLLTPRPPPPPPQPPPGKMMGPPQPREPPVQPWRRALANMAGTMMEPRPARTMTRRIRPPRLEPC